MKNLHWFLLSIFLFSNFNVSAQPEFDTTFASTGKTSVNSFSGTARDGTVQPDNKFLLTGWCAAGFSRAPFCVARMNEDGSLDAAFGTSGVVRTTIPGISSQTDGESKAVAVQNDGRIVVAGNIPQSNSMFMAAVRYNADGSVDASFGTNGFITYSMPRNSTVEAVAIQPNGKIVMVATVRFSDSNQGRVFRYNADGTPDQSFGSDGAVNISVAGSSTGGLSVALQPDGKIFIGGSIGSPTTPVNELVQLLARLNPDGSLDTSFDGDGIKTVPYTHISGGTVGFISVAVQSDGRVLALGGDSFIFRFNPDGSPDASFDGDGSRPAVSNVSDLTVTPSGKITVVGQRPFSSQSIMLIRVIRYLADGSPDTTFSDDGFLEYSVIAADNRASSVVYDSKGRTLIAGWTDTGASDFRFTATRLIASPAQNVVFSGRVTKSGGRAVANAYLTLKNGNTVIGYARTNPFGYFRFANVPSNATYTLSTNSKNLSFYDQSVLVDGAIENFLVVGNN